MWLMILEGCRRSAGKIMVAWTRMLAVKVVKSGGIVAIVGR